MKKYDYRIPDEVAEKVSATIDRLSNKDLKKVLEAVEGFRQTKEEQFTKAKEYFESAILPGLCDFAEMTGSVLYVEEHDEKMAMQAIFKNPLGHLSMIFDAKWQNFCVRKIPMPMLV